MQSTDKGLLRGLRAAVLFCCCILPLMAGAQTARAQESFIFSFPSIPDTLTTAPARATYLVAHYWDRATFPATVSSADNDSIEQAWVNYCDLFGMVDSSVVAQSLSQVLAPGRLTPSASGALMSLAEKYLFDTASPYGNDAAYLAALKAFTARADVDSLSLRRYASQQRMLTTCSVGGRPSNFRFVPHSGRYATFYSLAVPRLLLVLYDPECDHCQSLLQWLGSNARVARLLSQGRLFILSVNVGDATVAQSVSTDPSHWFDAYDPDGTIVASNRFDLRTMPLCLLLDGNKHVIGKGSEAAQVEQMLLSAFE